MVILAQFGHSLEQHVIRSLGQSDHSVLTSMSPILRVGLKIREPTGRSLEGFD